MSYMRCFNIILIKIKEFLSMDLTNRKIIQQLKENSKISLESIGKNVNLSTPSVRDRINKLKDIG
ncbi:AsnC family transcriptional regulator, partial [Staphylococcus succinus]|uniref:AsnC family transcriptional regulator n=1 Tax=Staphylococcus succinus TaxID=61015 RepID=UPI003B96CA4D